MSDHHATDADCAAELLSIARGLGYQLRAEGSDLVVVPPSGEQVSTSDAAMLTRWKPDLVALLSDENRGAA